MSSEANSTSTPVTMTSADQKTLQALLPQLINGKIDFIRFAQDLYGTQEVTRSNIESARIRWKNFEKKQGLGKEVGSPSCTPKKNKGGEDGSPQKATPKSRGRKRKNQDEVGGDLMESPTKKGKAGGKAKGLVKQEKQESAFEEALFGMGATEGLEDTV